MIKKSEVNVRTMLLELGTPPYLADMAIPFVWFTPGTTDPDSQPVMELIQAAQRGLGMHPSGILTAETARALDVVSGPEWMSKAWIQILGDVLTGQGAPKAAYRAGRLLVGAPVGLQGLGASMVEYGFRSRPRRRSFFRSNQYSLSGLGTTSTDQGNELTFGKGIKDPENMVPIGGLTKGIFEELQRQINRTGGSVAVDGIIGAGTLKGFKQSLSVISTPMLGAAQLQSISNTLQLASHAFTAMSSLQGLPSQPKRAVVAPRPKVDSTTAPITDQEKQENWSGGFGGGQKWILLGLLAAGGAWYAMDQRKGKRKSK